MVWPKNHSELTDMIISNRERIERLEQHKIECDLLHETTKEHRRRADDAMHSLTDSNIKLANAVTEFNITVLRLSAEVDKGKPVIEFWQKANDAWSFNKIVWASIISIIAGIIAIITLYNLL